VLHVDLTRISADELVTVELSIELRGEAPGVNAGGVIEHLLHQVEVECPAAAIPEKLYVNVNHLELEGSITLSQLDLPEKAKVFGDPETVVVQCVVPVEKPDEEAGVAVPGEPEVIGAKKEEEGED
jgi:large subunit ribosomal protein L25